jgi:ferredoxin/flavodoxin---NADP+ reductase
VGPAGPGDPALSGSPPDAGTIPRVTDVAAPERVILLEAPQYNASLVARVDETESLGYFTVRFDGDATPFEAGQYMTIGVFVEDPTSPAGTRIVQRPYSVASDPGVAASDGYEMYVRLVHGGLFTPLLWRLPIGHRMRMIGPKGKFTLEPDDDRTHLFISSGTGNAPFVAMMRTLLREGRPRKTVFLNGVSFAGDLGYRALVEDWQASGAYPVTYIPTVSRPNAPENAGWAGRSGRVESIVGPVCDELGLTPDNSIAYICGNPDMIIAAEETLLGRGFPEAQVKKELYWPKGKDPRGTDE